MKTRLYLLAVPVMLALAACRPGAAEYTESEAPKQLRVDSATTPLNIAFAAGSDRLAHGEENRLHQLALSGGITPEDRVTILASGDPLLQKRRVAAISGELLPYGILTAASPAAGVPRDRAIVAIGRYMVTLPTCPNWSQQPTADFTNSVSSNFGCTTASNLGMMVASPADLVSGRRLGIADARPEVTAVQRYVNDNLKTSPSQQFGTVLTVKSTSTTGSQ